MRPSTIHHLLRNAAEGRSDTLAVLDRGRSISFGELERRSNQLAHLLRGEGVHRGDRVGLHVPKSIESVVGIYAVLKAGAAYVPLDPESPQSRLAAIGSDCELRCLLTSTELASCAEALIEEGVPLETVVVLDAPDEPQGVASAQVRVLGAAAIDAQPETPPADGTTGFDLAYVLYTSGSTGRPKGVMLSHRNALSFVDWAVEEFGVGPDDRLSNHAPLHFDLSVFDLFGAAHAGAPVVLVPPETSVLPMEVRRFIEGHGITVWYSVPSVLRMLTLRGGLERGGPHLPTLRTVLFAGEVFPTPYLRRLMAALPHARFANLFGPTETNVCTWYDVAPLPPGRDDPIPIGKAIANVEVFGVTDQGTRARPGEIGELFVSGPTVMLGYWNDPERTGKVLVPHPFEHGRRDLCYRTGDRVQERPDGTLRFVGRRDTQVKTRGYRVELGEIEAALHAHPAVEECVAVAIPDEMITNCIRAYVVAYRPVDPAELLAHCARLIPRYMLPAAIEVRDALPRTSTGKLDRQALLGEALCVGGDS